MKTKLFPILCMILLISVSCNNEKELEASGDKEFNIPITKMDHYELMLDIDMYPEGNPQQVISCDKLVQIVDDCAYDVAYHNAGGRTGADRVNYAKGYSAAASIRAEKDLCGGGLQVFRERDGIHLITDIDLKNPVNVDAYYRFDMPHYQETADAGFYHNKIISAVLKNNPEFLYQDFSTSEAMREAYNNLIEEGVLQVNLIEKLEEDNENVDDFINNAEWIAGEILAGNFHLNDLNSEVLAVYHRNAVLVPNLLEYSKMVMEKIANSGIGQESIESLIGAVSIYVNSTILWNMKCPNPLQSNDFVVIYPNDEDNNDWYLFTGVDGKEMFYTHMRANSGNRVFGIPVLDTENKIRRIVFYDGFLKDMGYSSNIDYWRDGFFTANNNMLTNADLIAEIGATHFPAYSLQDYTFEGKEIFIVDFEIAE